MSRAVIVPCYNEAGRMPVPTFAAGLRSYPDWTWVFVNDGSTDHTSRLLARLVENHPNAHLLVLEKNSGKGEAVRQGVLWSLERNPDWIGYLDADLATPISEFARLSACADSRPELVAVLGSRILRLGTKIERNAFRHYLGRVAATAVSLLLSLPAYDTQCGAKLFRADLASEIFAEPFESRWLFDVELLARSRNRLGHQNFENAALEEPLQVWLEQGGSKIRFRDLLALPHEMWQIHRRYNRRRL